MFLTSSSVRTSIWRDSKNFCNVEQVMTCIAAASMPAQLVKILDAAIASKHFFCAHCASVNSVSSELFLVSKPVACLGYSKRKNNLFFNTNQFFVGLLWRIVQVRFCSFRNSTLTCFSLLQIIGRINPSNPFWLTGYAAN